VKLFFIQVNERFLDEVVLCLLVAEHHFLSVMRLREYLVVATAIYLELAYTPAALDGRPMGYSRRWYATRWPRRQLTAVALSLWSDLRPLPVTQTDHAVHTIGNGHFRRVFVIVM
jgi:hypothetical protein